MSKKEVIKRLLELGLCHWPKEFRERIYALLGTKPCLPN